MIRIYGETPELDLPNNADLEDVLSTMEELDEIYKERTANSADYITVHKSTLYYAFLYAKDNLDENTEKIFIEIINLWDKFLDEQKEQIITTIKPLIAEEKFQDNKIYSWYKKVS